jgi:hypothetical protein
VNRIPVLFSMVLAACGAAQATPEPAVDAARARAIAIETGAASGYDPAVYTELGEPVWHAEDGTWWVPVEHAPPAPPGGHYAVTVDGTSGEATLRHGE